VAEVAEAEDEEEEAAVEAGEAVEGGEAAAAGSAATTGAAFRGKIGTDVRSRGTAALTLGEAGELGAARWVVVARLAGASSAEATAALGVLGERARGELSLRRCAAWAFASSAFMSANMSSMPLLDILVRGLYRRLRRSSPHERKDRNPWN
jgi:hypothetical protein